MPMLLALCQVYFNNNIFKHLACAKGLQRVPTCECVWSPDIMTYPAILTFRLENKGIELAASPQCSSEVETPQPTVPEPKFSRLCLEPSCGRGLRIRCADPLCKLWLCCAACFQRASIRAQLWDEESFVPMLELHECYMSRDLHR